MVALRKVNLQDCELLFDWANDKEARKNSFNTDIIKYEEHLIWFSKILKDNNVLLYIMEVDNLPVGQVRINIEGSNGIISYSISKNYRGQKFGFKIIELIDKEIYSLKAINKIIAYVKKDNEASKKVFRKLKFLEIILKDKYLYYKVIKK